MKIGVIGSRKSTEVVSKIIKNSYFFIEPEFFTFRNYSEVKNILREYETKMDAILFTGYTTFKYASNFFKPSVPWEYIPRDRMSFVYTMIKAIHIKGYDISRISIDSYNEKIIYETYKEIGFKKDDIHIYRSNYNILEEDYFEKLIEFHMDCYNKGNINLCVTCIYDVYEILIKNNIPCIHVDYSTDVVMEYINKLRLRHQLKISEESILVTINMTIDMIEENSIYSKNELQKLQYRNKIHEIIYAYAQRIEAAIIKPNDDSYYIFTTKSVLQNDTQNFKDFKLLNNIQNDSTIKNINIGIGLGDNPLESKHNAEVARRKAEKSNINCVFIIDKDNQITGPITSVTKNIEDKKIDSQLLNISHQTGVGLSTIYKIENIIKQYKITSITPNELAKKCEISTRSINRIITKLEDKGYVRVVGKRAQDTTGRPSRLIEIDFNSNFKV